MISTSWPIIAPSRRHRQTNITPGQRETYGRTAQYLFAASVSLKASAPCVPRAIPSLEALCETVWLRNKTAGGCQRHDWIFGLKNARHDVRVSWMSRKCRTRGVSRGARVGLVVVRDQREVSLAVTQRGRCDPSRVFRPQDPGHRCRPSSRVPAISCSDSDALSECRALVKSAVTLRSPPLRCLSLPAPAR